MKFAKRVLGLEPEGAYEVMAKAQALEATLKHAEAAHAKTLRLLERITAARRGMFIDKLLATILWASVSVMRVGFLRWLLALVVLYALWQNYETIAATGTSLANLVDLAASLVAGAATAVLFRADARAWFAAVPDDSGIG